MITITTDVSFQLRRIARQLPVVMQESLQNLSINGEDLKLTGIPKGNDMKLEDIKDEDNYLIKTPLLVQQNHYRIMKKLYMKHGGQAVIDYCEKMKRLALEQNKSPQ